MQCLVTWSSHRYFYPRPPRGGRLVLVWSRNSSEGFLSTPSARRATCCRWGSSPGCVYFYPRPPRGGRRMGQERVCHRRDFYPRPPRGGRLACLRSSSTTSSISIHALREEGDAVKQYRKEARSYFYPRPPRGGRHAPLNHAHMAALISIHALREEGDATTPEAIETMLDFYPRPPRGGRRQGR